MSNKTDAMMSGMGWATQFISKLTKELKSMGWSNDQIHALVKDESVEMISRGAKAFADAVALPGKVFNFTINHDQSIEDLVKAGFYDYVNSNVTSENFGDDREGKEEIELFLLSFEDLFGEKRSATTDKVLSAMKEKGYKPAGQVHGIRALLTLGQTHPDEQRQGPIIDLGLVCQDSGGLRNVLALWSGHSDRELILYWIEDEWNSVYRFAAVRA